MGGILRLPAEVLQSVLLLCQPADLGPLTCSCRTLHDFIKGNWLLWRALYLKELDPLPKGPDQSEPDWETSLHEVIALEKILDTPNLIVKRDELLVAGGTILKLLRYSNINYSRAGNLKWLAKGFNLVVKDSKNLDTMLTSSSLFELAGDRRLHKPASTEAQRQLSAKLHVMWGMPISFQGLGRRTRKTVEIQPTNIYARSRVYDLSTYTEATKWGPFMESGSGHVDWEKMEAIFVVLGHNLTELSNRTSGLFPWVWTKPWFGVTPYGWKDPGAPPLQDMIEREETEVVKRDPYNLTGTWMRVVCFLDYSDLYAHNFANGDGDFPEAITTDEATRIIEMNITTTKIEPPGPDDGQDLPVAHFVGRSRSLHDPFDPHSSSALRGTVRQTKEGEVWWTTFSVYEGEERWRSEGIQVGGPATRRGVLGTWFDKDYSPEGPAGPSAFWKISDRLRNIRPGNGQQWHMS